MGIVVQNTIARADAFRPGARRLEPQAAQAPQVLLDNMTLKY
jgi:hypothetical protein